MRTILFQTLFTFAVALASFAATILVATPVMAATPKKEAKKAEAPKAAAASELEEVSDASFGYRIRIPKGAKVLQKEEWGHTYSLPLPGGHEYNVSLGKVAAASLEDAVSAATMMGPKEIEKRDAGELYLVVKGPQFGTTEVFAFRKGAELSAKCAGPEREKARLVEICSSLQGFKK